MVQLRAKSIYFDLESGSAELAGRTEGRNGRDIKSCVQRAEQKAVQRALELGGPEYYSLSLADFDEPLRNIQGQPSG